MIHDMTDAAIKHAVELLKPFVEKGYLRLTDAPIHEVFRWLDAFAAMYPGQQRRTVGEWQRLAEEAEIQVRPAPRGRTSLRLRRAIIVSAIEEIEALGFQRGRNQANYDKTDKPASACSIVAAALGMSEEEVVEIVREPRRKKRKKSG